MKSIISAVAGLRRRHALPAIVAGAVGMSACLSLDVANPNNLDLTSVFTNAANVEASIIGSWRRYGASTQGRGTVNQSSQCPSLPFSMWANEMTSTNTSFIDFSQEPRIPIDNLNTLNCTTRGAWYDMYAAIAGARDGYQAIETYGHKYGTIDATTPDGADTPRLKIFAKFVMALSHIRLGLANDSAFLTDMTTDATAPQTLVGHSQTIAHGIAQMREVIADARAANNFTFPTHWINQRAITRDELIRIAYSYIVRAEVYSARNPTERAAVNWTLVLAQLDSTITRDFGEQAQTDIGSTTSPWVTASFASNTIRISNRLLGPADTSGRYQTWLGTPLATRTSFQIITPDRRIHAANNPAGAGSRFTRLTSTMGSISNAPYLASQYRSNRYLNASSDSGSRAFINFATVEEMNFIRAEALHFLGQGAAAAAIINPSRIAAGLPAATASGPPVGNACVPKKDLTTKVCGDLYDAIQYEKRIQLFPLEAEVTWYDQRGWGKLLPGTPIHLPVSGRELIALGLPYYTYGGVGGLGAAP